ncbi:EpsG family protein [Vibrio parahaemolyticus]
MIYYYVLLFSTLLAALSFSKLKLLDEDKQYCLRLAFLSLSFLTFWLIAGLRYKIGAPDWFEYDKIFNQVSDGIFNIRFEIGYLYLNYVLSYISNDSQIVFLSVSLFVTIAYYYFCYRTLGSPYFLIAVLIYISTLYFNLNMYNVRQHIAISIFYFSIIFISIGRYIRAVLALMFAGLFHTTAFALIPLLFLLKIKFNRWIIAIIFFVGYIFLILNISLADYIIYMLRFNDYLNGVINLSMSIDGLNSPRTGGFLGMAERLFFLFVVLKFYEELVKDSTSRMVTNLYLIYLAVYLFLSSYGFFIVRLNLYFASFFPIAYVLILKNQTRRKDVIFILFAIYSIVKFTLYILGQVGNPDSFVPYRSYLESLL